VVFDNRNGENVLAYEDQLAEVLSARVRLTDEMGWLDDNHISVCLANAPAKGASKFAEDVCQKMNPVVSLCYTVYTYPSDCLPVAGGNCRGPLESATAEIPAPISHVSKDGLNEPTPQRGTDLLFISNVPVWKRCIDIVGALAAIILFAPPMLLISLSIKLSSPGPILFRQSRIGYRGKNFMMYKFRSMTTKANDDLHADYISRFIRNRAEKNSDGLLKIKDDPRITLIGKFIRKWSLDELPQLFNVLKGDMSLVGPRPDPYYAIPHYARWYYRRIMETKPGITGLWQVEGRSRVPFEEMVRMDIRYCLSLSFICDCKLILRTFKAVLSRIGAY
jgi:lipopolysaccharide/colanic/teichoic acid biosynthesis glycosyltransferase